MRTVIEVICLLSVLAWGLGQHRRGYWDGARQTKWDYEEDIAYRVDDAVLRLRDVWAKRETSAYRRGRESCQ